MNNIGIWLYIYMFSLNVLAFVLYALDKHRAYFNQWRIPEYILLGIPIIGGAYGAAAGMLLFRHKTKNKSFYITVPLCFLLWMILLVVTCITNTVTYE